MVAYHRIVDANLHYHNGLSYGNNGVYLNGNKLYDGLRYNRYHFSGDVSGNNCHKRANICRLRNIEYVFCSAFHH